MGNFSMIYAFIMGNFSMVYAFVMGNFLIFFNVPDDYLLVNVCDNIRYCAFDCEDFDERM